MTDIKKYSREWFVSFGSNEQKQAAKNLVQNSDKLIYGDLDKSLFVGKNEDIIKNFKDIEKNQNGKYIIDAKIIKSFGGIDNLLKLIDLNGDGKISQEEIEIVSFADEDELNQKNNNFSAKDLKSIYDNVMASDGCVVKETKNSSHYIFKDGLKVYLSKSNDGNIVYKYTEEQQLNNQKKIKSYDYANSTKHSVLYDDKNRVTYSSIVTPNKSSSKIRYIVYDDNNSERKVTEITAGKNIKKTLDIEGNIISQSETLRYNSDGIIGNTQQRNIGNCWMLSAVNAINSSEKGRQLIKDSIVQHSDGSVTVKLRGVNKEYTYTPDEIGAHEYIDKDSSYSFGDIDMNLLEMAVTDYRAELKQTSIKGVFVDSKDPLTSGFNREGLYYLTGITAENTYMASSTLKMLDKKQSDVDGYALTTSFKKDDPDFKDATIITGHTYSINRVTEDTVYLLNPWDSGAEIAYPKNKFLKMAEGVSLIDFSKLK